VTVDGTDRDGVPGEAVHCSTCEEPVVLYEHPARGYRLVCGCNHTSVGIDDVAANSSLFTPLTGRWSTIDDSPSEGSNTQGAKY